MLTVRCTAVAVYGTVGIPTKAADTCGTLGDVKRSYTELFEGKVVVAARVAMPDGQEAA
jgi:hypothetical protein